MIQRFARYVSASALSVYLLVQPITALILEAVVCGRRFGVVEVAGVVLLMAASLGVSGALKGVSGWSKRERIAAVL